VLESAAHRLAIPFADLWRPTAANYWGRVKKAHGIAIGREILGERWARDHADDKKPVLAMALETAFDPQKSNACIALDQAARETAATWLPPGMAYDAVNSPAADDLQADDDGAAPRTGDDTAPASADLPDFLTEHEPAPADDLPLAATSDAPFRKRRPCTGGRGVFVVFHARSKPKRGDQP
jgi:ParB family chromosome partitioning protein